MYENESENENVNNTFKYYDLSECLCIDEVLDFLDDLSENGIIHYEQTKDQLSNDKLKIYDIELIDEINKKMINFLEKNDVLEDFDLLLESEIEDEMGDFDDEDDYQKGYDF